MGAARWRQGVVLLVLVAVPLSLPDLETTSYNGWPATGLVVALLLTAGREGRVIAFGALTVLATTALTLAFDVDVLRGLAGSLALTLPALLTARLLAPDGRGRLLLEQVSVVRYHLAIAVSALLTGAIGALAVLSLMPAFDVLLTGTMSFLAALTAQLVVLPQMMRVRRDRVPHARRGEMALQRVLLAATVVAVFAPQMRLGPTFLVFPLLAWVALRGGRREAHLQMLLVGLAAYSVTHLGVGPLTSRATSLPETAEPTLVYLFIAATALMVVPLAQAMETLDTVTTRANRDATTVERMLTASTGAVFMATDRAGRITHYNSGAQHALEYAVDEVVGHHPRLFHEDKEILRQAQHFGVEPDHAAVVLAQVESGERRDWEFISRSGRVRTISLGISEVCDAQGRVQGYIAAGEDVTERMRTQEALVAALDREHASVLRLQEVDHVKQELISTVSHELRTPITSIAGYTELLTDASLGGLGPAQLDAVERIGRNAARLGVLVEDLLVLSRSESGQLELRSEEVDLRDCVTEACDLLAEQVRSRALVLDLDLPARPVPVLGDAEALERVVTNLVGNAVKFTPSGGRVTVTLACEEPSVRLEVRDTGIGISPEDQQHLFTRFYRTAAATQLAIQGSGLGLSIVQAIVSRHGGEVAVESVPDVGTAVTVRLPAHRQVERARRMLLAPRGPGAAAPPDPRAGGLP